MKINVIGLGYVGLPTAIMIASSKYIVKGVDVNLGLINDLTNNIHIMEDESLQRLLQSKIGNCLNFGLSPSKADYHFIAVPTPFLTESKKVDLVFIKQVIEKLLLLEQDELRIVIESTISPGTIDILNKEYSNKNSRIVFFHAPERVLPGNSYNELVHNDRVIGTDILTTLRNLLKSISLFARERLLLPIQRLQSYQKLSKMPIVM
jgi:UDP-N-acetyl-D-mannosaminuronic acid dehydrogenase